MPGKGLKRPRSEVKVKLKKFHPDGCYVCAVTRSTRFYHLPEYIIGDGHLLPEPERPNSLVLCQDCYREVQQMRKPELSNHEQNVRTLFHMHLKAILTTLFLS
jgi:hypothetical protein